MYEKSSRRSIIGLAVKIVTYILAGNCILLGGLALLRMAFLTGLAGIAAGIGLIWLERLWAEGGGRGGGPGAMREQEPVWSERGRLAKASPAFLLVGLTLGALCGASSSCILGYASFKAMEPGWQPLPGPPEKGAAILRVTSDEVVVQTEMGNLYTCKSGETACRPVEMSESETAELATWSCLPGQAEISPRPPGTVIDSCTILLYGEAPVMAILLEDNRLYTRSAGNFDLPQLFAMLGIPLGCTFGLLVGVVCAMRMSASVIQDRPLS